MQSNQGLWYIYPISSLLPSCYFSPPHQNTYFSLNPCKLASHAYSLANHTEIFVVTAGSLIWASARPGAFQAGPCHCFLGSQARHSDFPATAWATILQLASKAFLKTVGFLLWDGHIAKIWPNPQLEVPYMEMTSHSHNKCFNKNLIRLSFSLSMKQALMHVATSQENKMILTVFFPRISISL